MATNPVAYLRALYPLGQPPHLSDEQIARQLDEELIRSRAARKGIEAKRRRRETAASKLEEGRYS
jgi:N-glycosylase/DNA lyase